MIRNRLSTSLILEEEESHVKSRHYLIEQPHSLRKYKQSYTTRKVNEIKQKYRSCNELKKNTVSSRNNEANKENRLKSTNREEGKLIKRQKVEHNKTKRQIMGKRIQQLQGLNIKLHEMIINLKQDYQEFEQSSKPQRNAPLSNIIKQPKRHKRQLSESNLNYLANDSRVSSKENRRNTSCLYGNRSVGSLQSEERGFRTMDMDGKKFIRRICKQIKYDQEFIKIKQKIYKYRMGSQKLVRIFKSISKVLPQFSKENIHNLLQIDQEEIDPFYTERQTEKPTTSRTLTQQLIEAFVKAVRYWQQKVQKQFYIEELQMKDLDVRKNGKIDKGDFARFISTHAKKLYCNRDICLIFKRMMNWEKEQDWISIQKFVASFCK